MLHNRMGKSKLLKLICEDMTLDNINYCNLDDLYKQRYIKNVTTKSRNTRIRCYTVQWPKKMYFFLNFRLFFYILEWIIILLIKINCYNLPIDE